MELAILRLLHLVFGFFWAGGAVIVGIFVIPSVVEAGPGGGAVMRGVVVQRKLPQLMTAAGLITIVVGLRLYMLKFSMGWLATPEGIVLTLGSVLAVAGFFIGVFVQRPLAMKLTALGEAIVASGQPPTAEQQAEITHLQGRMLKIGRVLAAHLGAAVVLMSSMRLAQQLSM